MMATVKVVNLGRLAYRPALEVQRSLVAAIKKANENGSKPNNILLLVEHDPVYTTGIRSKEYTAEEEVRLRSLGADFVRTDRGGLITFHGPGQLVAYPVLDLRNFIPAAASRKALLGMKWYIDRLEQTVIDVCHELGVAEACRSPHTGVWVGDRSKICAMGVHNSGFVTSHGLALNCNPDLDWFGHIVPCGIVGKGVTSLTAELNQEVTREQVVPVLINAFARQFQCETTSIENLDTEPLSATS